MANAFSSVKGGRECEVMGEDGGRRAQVAKKIPGYGTTEQRREQLRPTQEKSAQGR